MGADRLMVIIPDRLSELVDKGEVTERYYNPGDLFRKVDILLMNDDAPDPAAVQPMVGSADLAIHNLPEAPGLFKRSLAWRPRLLRGWASGAVELARQLQPQLIRCHGAHLNAYCAGEIKRRLGVPYVVSMHTNPDNAGHREYEAGADWRVRLQARAAAGLARSGLSNADCVVAVYSFIVPYAERMGARRVEVIYNVVCPSGSRPKEEFALAADGLARIVVPGRQIAGKDPTPVLEAVADLPDVHLTLIGEGARHDELRATAERLGLAGRADFVRALPNDELCMSLRSYDALVSVNDYGGVSKVELEAALVGMPTITNRHPAESEPEVLGGNCIAVDGDAASYRAAIERLLGDSELRERLGTQLRESVDGLRPERMEQAYVDLYRELARL